MQKQLEAIFTKAGFIVTPQTFGIEVSLKRSITSLEVFHVLDQTELDLSKLHVSSTIKFPHTVVITRL